MGWAYGLNLNAKATSAEDASVESWEGDHPNDREALLAARGQHGMEADVIVAWIDRLSYANMLPSIETLLGEMQERVAEAGGDTTCFDSLSVHDITQLRDEIVAAVEVWEEGLAEEKQSTGVKVTHRRRHPPEIRQ